MSDSRWDRLETLFEDALTLPPDRRRHLIDAASEDDPELRRAVESLLEADQNAAGFLARPAMPPTDAVPGTLGPYRLLECLAEGEMSSVYLAARDDDAFERRVVIKVVRRGAESFDVLRRLRLERQILARLDHPSIAKLHDGGTTSDQRPYFVMEHVDGLPIDRFADQGEYGVTARVTLLRRVAEAVHVAHQNLVIHRDLKPSNILVTPDGTPKLLDFGIARIIGAGASPESAARTRRWQRVLTPDYASPEQIRGEPLSIACDIYALGVILYELLCGRRPRRLADLSLEAMARQASDHAPVAPSRALAALTVAERRAVARSRRGRPEALERRLRGDLDAIVLKALRPAPARRYASALALAEDLERWSNGLPVHARRGGLLYLGTRMARRHRRALAVTGLLVALAFAFAAGEWRRNRELKAALADEAKARAVQGAFLESLIDSSRSVAPAADREALSMPQVLDRLRDQVDARFADDPRARAAFERMIATVHANLGQLDRATTILEDAFEHAREALGRKHPETARILGALGGVLGERGDTGRALVLARTAVAIAREHTLESVTLAELLNGLVTIHCIRGAYAEARPFADEALARTRGTHGGARLAALTNRAQIANHAGDHLGARRRYTAALEVLDALGADDDPRRASIARNLGATHHRLGDYEAALRLGQEALDHLRRTLGPRHPSLIPSLNNVASAESRLGDHAAAEAHFREARALLSEASPQSPRLLWFDEKIALLMVDQGRVDEALAHLRASLRRQDGGEEHPFGARLHLALGRILVDRGRFHEARRHLETAAPVLAANRDPRRADEARTLLRDLANGSR